MTTITGYTALVSAAPSIAILKNSAVTRRPTSPAMTDGQSRSSSLTRPFNMVDETSNSAVVLLCGIPASGKSTLSKEIHRYVLKTRGDTIHVIYVCYDNFIPRDLKLNNAFAGSQLADKLCEEDIAKEQTNSRSDSNAIESSNYSLWKHYRRILLVAVDRLLNIMKNKNNEFRFDSYDSTSEIEGLPPFHMFWKTFQENLSKEITNCSCFCPNDCR